MAVYWFPFNAFDGDIINPCEEFVKGFLEIYAEKIWLVQIYANMRENMQRYTAAEKTNLGLQGSALHPLKPFLKEGFKNPKNFQKALSNNPF